MYNSVIFKENLQSWASITTIQIWNISSLQKDVPKCIILCPYWTPGNHKSTLCF